MDDITAIFKLSTTDLATEGDPVNKASVVAS